MSGWGRISSLTEKRGRARQRRLSIPARLTNTTDTATGIWSDSYSGAKRCNDVIKYSDWVEDISAENKADIISQVRLLRAFYYTQLWKFYGNVPIYFENLTDPYIYPQSQADEVYDKIVTELEDLIDNGALKNDYSDDEKGHVTKDLAYMLFTEIVMIQNDNARYPKALSYMQELISSGKYKLVDDFNESTVLIIESIKTFPFPPAFMVLT